MKPSSITLLLVFYVLAFSPFFSGCGNPVVTARKADPNDESKQPDLKRFEIGGSLAKNLQVASVNQATVNGDLLKIQANVRNLKKDATRITYKIEWMDENGIVINDASGVWLPIRIRGGETAAIQSVATTPRAKDFRIKMQRAKND